MNKIINQEKSEIRNQFVEDLNKILEKSEFKLRSIQRITLFLQSKNKDSILDKEFLDLLEKEFDLTFNYLGVTEETRELRIVFDLPDRVRLSF